MNCIQDVVCIPPAVPDGSGGCTFLGVCLATGDGIYTPSYNTTEQYKQRDNWFDSWSGYFKPYGNVEMFWTCKENS